MRQTNHRQLCREIVATCAALVLAAAAPAVAAPSVGEPLVSMTPTPATTTNSVLSAISCASDDSCVAVGSAQTHGFHRTGLIESWNGTRWSIAAASLFSGLKPATLRSVSCPTVAQCVAVGDGTTANATNLHGQQTQPIAVREVDGHWRVSRPVVRSGDVTVDGLSGLSCAEPSDCEASGNATENGRGVTVIERLHLGRWTLSTTSRLPGARATTPEDIGCSAASSCLVSESGFSAVGSDHRTRSRLLRLTGGGWHAVSPSLGPNVVVTNVSCPTGGPCVAFAHDVQSGTLDEVSESGTLTPLPKPVPAGGRTVDIGGLTCSALDQCFGLGTTEALRTGTDTTPGLPVAETYDGTAFTLAFTGLPLRLGGFACRPTFCMLVGSHARKAAASQWDWPTTMTDHRSPTTHAMSSGRAGASRSLRRRLQTSTTA
jgi:hypothetical protein